MHFPEGLEDTPFKLAETVKNRKKKSRGNAEGLKIKTRVLNPF